ncbi:M23 family metallopeptidase [Calditerrivibrio sp.]|uniref:Peptidase M23 n=1 Tax=Calditerrivibrio nitroreducens TaxID=477976 RepID=A0A2J6WL58_9BACT|nr:MAG: peptidase M23 [Calditerrivibrio nitroreducens]
MFLKRYILKFLHFFKKKDEHVTVLIFKDSGLGEVKARNVHHSTLKAFVIGGLSFLFFAMISFVAASFLFKERMTALKYLAENQMLKMKISEYNKKLSEIEAKINYLQEYEQKIRGLSKELKISPKYLPQGGKETSLDSLSIEKNLSYKDVEQRLRDADAIKKRLEEKEKSMADLMDTLNAIKLVVDSTPTILPANGWISSYFGKRVSPFGRGIVFHEGIDISLRPGTPIRATAAGVVVYSGWQQGYGRLVVIDHGFGYKTKYAHNSVLKVKIGQKVKRGTIVALSGSSGDSTGPHCHYEIVIGNTPVDPLKFMKSNRIASLYSGRW